MPTPWLYRAGIRAAVPLLPLVLNRAQREAHRSRLTAVTSVEMQASRARDRSRPLAWFHTASVGEGLQARAVLHALKALRPDLQVAWTHFSPSAEALRASIGADIAGYLPYDRPADMSRMLAALQPDVLVFSKLDLWPELTLATAKRGTPVVMVAATVDSGSSRLRWPVTALTRAGYAALSKVAAISPADGDRMVALGAAREAVIVTGDPRVDSVLDALVSLQASGAILLGTVDPDRTLVAGSTWPEDEAVLLAAWRAVQVRHPDAVMIVVPHEPSPERVSELLRLANEHVTTRAVVLSAWRGEPADIVIVDRVGVLAALYAAGGMAYVGGGFGRRGVHSVLEPAALSRPVIIGPRDRGLRDAALLESEGGLVRLPTHHPAAALAAQWTRWLADPAERALAGAAARRALSGDQGAAQRSAALLAAQLKAPVSTPSQS